MNFAKRSQRNHFALSIIRPTCRIKFSKICSMDNVGQIGVEDTFEFKFARDIIRYVVEERMKGLYWMPTGIFEKRNLAEHLTSPFTPQMKKAVNEKLDIYENIYHRQYDNYFKDETVTENYLNQISWILADNILEEFNVKNFFTFCVILAKYAGYSYLYDITSAPENACKIIIRIVRAAKAYLMITDSFWYEMQDFAENPDLIDDQPEDFSETSESTETADEFE